MHYLYVLEGRLKYETISFESTVVFNLYNKNVERKNETVDSDELIYFLKSDVDVVITVNLATNTILLSAPLNETVLLFDDTGSVREVDAEREISIAGNVVKFKIDGIDFSFLIDSMTDPEVGSLSALNAATRKGKTPYSIVEVDGFGFGGIDFLSLNKVTISIIAIIMIAIVGYIATRITADSTSSNLMIFNNESELMRADLQKLNSNEILVKTHLLDKVQVYLDQQGFQYVKFNLEKQKNGKFNLLLNTFFTEEQNVDQIANHFDWIGSVIVQVIDIRNMFDDFNKLAGKYGLVKIDRNQTKTQYQLIEISFINKNLKFESLQRDLRSFYERWGRNYIEFNVSLKRQRNELPIDFILKRENEAVIKSEQGFYIN